MSNKDAEKTQLGLVLGLLPRNDRFGLAESCVTVYWVVWNPGRTINKITFEFWVETRHRHDNLLIQRHRESWIINFMLQQKMKRQNCCIYIVKRRQCKYEVGSYEKHVDSEHRCKMPSSLRWIVYPYFKQDVMQIERWSNQARCDVSGWA